MTLKREMLIPLIVAISLVSVRGGYRNVPRDSVEPMPYTLSLDGGRGQLRWGVETERGILFQLTCKRGHDLFGIGFSDRGDPSPADYVISYKDLSGQRIIVVSGNLKIIAIYNYFYKF